MPFLKVGRRCNFREKETFRQAQYRKCRARYRDVAKTTCGIRQSNYLPLLLYRIPLDGTSLFRGSCIDVIKSRLRKNLKVPASSRIMPFLKVGEIRRRKKRFRALKELDRTVKRIIENVALVTVTSRKQHAVFGKVIICPCYCIVFP
jgi:hypothetical protein